MPPVRNSHIIRHTLRHYLVAAIFAGIIIQLNSTIDSMVAGQFIGADAVSVIILALPLGMLLPMLDGLAAEVPVRACRPCRPNGLRIWTTSSKHLSLYR